MNRFLENAQSRNSKRFYTWKLNVLKRDGFICKKCGSNKKLVAHHIVRWRDDESLRFEISNGMTLCRACHIVVHQEMGDTGMKGKNHSEKTKAQISRVKKGMRLGIKTGPMSDQTKAKVSAAKKGIKLGPMPEEQKEKIRIANTGKTGRKASEETLNKMRAAQALRSHINGAQYKGKTWIKCQETGKRIWLLNYD